MTDDLGGTTTQVVSITLANVDDAAVITGDVSYSGNEGDAVAGDMDATDVDGLTDGTYFTVTTPATNGTSTPGAANVTIVNDRTSPSVLRAAVRNSVPKQPAQALRRSKNRAPHASQACARRYAVPLYRRSP